MTIRHVVQAVAISVVAVFLMAASASAAVITFNTSSANTKFVSTNNLSLPSSGGGTAATLSFATQGNSSPSVPPTSNVNYGIFTLGCPNCTLVSGGIGATFGAFTFNLVITDVTDGATGTFVGSSPGGVVFLDLSTITVSWAPLQIGPGGSFGSTFFTTTSPTGIVNPSSGTNDGQSTVQGAVGSNAIPEPATLGLIGGGLIGLGLLRRRDPPASSCF